MIREFRLIDRLRERLGPVVGDDAAVLDGGLLLCADSVVAGVHADLSLVGLDDFGWKALVANLSDIAAMGGVPRAAVVTVSGPLGTVDVDMLYDGLQAASDLYACPVVGGDLTAAPELVVSAAVLGEADAPVLRSGARPGDTVFVTGPLGASAAGLALLQAGRVGEDKDLESAHRRPRARLAEGTAARLGGATAMIDVSDGLAVDAVHLAAASGVGLVVERVPIALGVARVADNAEALALGGGEDYELVFAAPQPLRVEEAFASAGLTAPLRIGVCTADPSERRLRDGPLPMLGWEHAW